MQLSRSRSLRGSDPHQALRLAGLAVVGVLALAVIGWASGSGDPGSPAASPRTRPAAASATVDPAAVRMIVGRRTLATFVLSRYRTGGRLNQQGLRRAVIARLPSGQRVRRGTATVTYILDRSRAASAAVQAAALGGAAVQVPRRVIASVIAAPVLKQRLRNNCETAALSILLRTVGVTVDQLQLQDQLPRSGTPDPVGTGSAMRWGDPDLGYVGRAAGGGVAGGFGVYQQPITALAKRHGVELEDLTGKTIGALMSRLREGHAVMAWVGLGAGPYGSWTSPQGKTINVNFNEHTVVLRGLSDDGTISISNPLEGTAERWTMAQFQAMWRRLGGRALATT